ncbi:MAG: hypothetical protein ABIJ09_19665 [Pseudomonadota bacterium]
MKRFLAFFVVVVAFGAALGAAFVSFKTKLTEQRLLVAKSVVDMEFMNKLTATRMVPGNGYKGDMSILLSNYGQSLDRLYKDPEFALLRDDDLVRKLYQEEHKKGRKDDRTLQQVTERIDYTQAAYKEIANGDYRPMVSAQADGLRVDLYAWQKAPVDGQDRLQVKVVIVGGDPEALTFGHIEMKMGIKSFVEKKVKGQMVKEEVLKLAKISGGGSPNTLIKDPRKWMPDFPPGIQIGFYDFPLFPSTATEVQLTMGFGIRTIGGNQLSPELKFDPIVIDSSWKLPPGASWEAEEVEGTEEELAEFNKSQQPAN